MPRRRPPRRVTSRPSSAAEQTASCLSQGHTYLELNASVSGFFKASKEMEFIRLTSAYSLTQFSLGKPQKKNLFLMAGPLRPYPSELNGHWKIKITVQKSSFFVNGPAFTPPPSLLMARPLREELPPLQYAFLII